jgi:hypothetical protein
MEEEWLDNSQPPAFYSGELKERLQSFMNGLSGIPFIRESLIFKQFLEYEKHGGEDSENRRNTLLIQPHHGHSLTTMPFGGPASGRRSVSPFVNKVLYHKPQESANDSARLSMMPTTTNKDQILEMAEDEDYSSLASN